jgi:MFS family permease
MDMTMARATTRSLAPLLPIMGAVFASFLVIGLALPVLPLHVHQGLGLGTFIVGLVAGSQFAAALISRVWAGRHADLRGAKHAVAAGLALAVAAGLLYLLSLPFIGQPGFSVAILLAGRAVLGAGESFIITGAQAWGLILAGPQNTGKVIAWMGTAMYAAFALGAPIGTTLYGSFGFISIALATTLLPLAALMVVANLEGVTATARSRPSFMKVVKAVWLPGVGLALTSTGFGAMTAFVALLFAARGWPVWPAFTVFAVAFILARTILGSVADRRGGARVALVFLLIEAVGQTALWLAPSSALGLAGAALTGFGYSLVYPGFGVEAVRRAPADSRGLAMGAYTAFLDVALAVASPLLGLLAAANGIGSVFLASALATLCAAPIALRLMKGST